MTNNPDDISSELENKDVSVEELEKTIMSSLAYFIPFAVKSNEFSIRKLLVKRETLGTKTNQERFVIKDAIDGINTTITTLTKSLDTLTKFRKTKAEGDNEDGDNTESPNGDNVAQGMDGDIQGLLQDDK
jgi:hypothetical protein